MSVNSLCGSAPPMDAAPTTLGVANAMGASSDGDGLTPVMRAVLSGQLDQAVQLALSAPADLGSRDAQGRTAIELAVGANKREISLALLLIATAKFTRPLSPLLPVAILTRLQAWVLDRQGKNAKAAAVVAQQHVASRSACARTRQRVMERTQHAPSPQTRSLVSTKVSH